MGNYRISDSHPFTEADLCTSRFIYDPRSAYNPGASLVTTLTGTTEYTGYPRSLWKFAALTIEQWTALRTLIGGYSGEIYIETHDDDDTWREWRAIARMPEPKKLDRWSGVYKNVEIEMVLVEDVTP